jgi:hypothetical protein
LLGFVLRILAAGNCDLLSLDRHLFPSLTRQRVRNCVHISGSGSTYPKDKCAKNEMDKLIRVVSFLMCGVLGFFSAGAIYFPLAEDYWLRVVLSIGGMAIVYGGESVIRLGHVRACTISFGGEDCKEYSVLVPALILWACFYLLWVWFRRDKTPAIDVDKTQKIYAADPAAGPSIFESPKIIIAVVALLLFAICLWTRLRPPELGIFGRDHNGLMVVLTVVFAGALYGVTCINRLGTSKTLVKQIAISGGLAFLISGVVYQALARSEFPNSPIAILTSFLPSLFSAGVMELIPFGKVESCVAWESLIFGSGCNETSVFVPVLLMWLAIFMLLRWRFEERLSPASSAAERLSGS